MKKIYLLPNAVTTANLFCGFYSMLLSFRGNFLTAAWLIVAAMIFDALDGRVARMARATSQFGVEYDSLSDLTSFGIAPAILVYSWVLEPYDRLGIVLSFAYVVCAAFRLARFNVTTSSLPKAFFQGLPSPVGAGWVATFVIFQLKTELIPVGKAMDILTMVFLVLSAALMASSVPFPSFKDLNWRSKTGSFYLLLALAIVGLASIRPEWVLFLAILATIFITLLWNIFYWVQGSSVIDVYLKKKAETGKGQL